MVPESQIGDDWRNIAITLKSPTAREVSLRFSVSNATGQRDKHENPEETNWGEVKPAVSSPGSLNRRKVYCCEASPTNDAFNGRSWLSFQPEQDPNK
jgi:hypothetical protein